MEGGALEMETSAATDPRVASNCTLATLKRRAWAQSKDSTWPESQERCETQGPQQNQGDGDEQRPSAETGPVPNKITSWLIECRTPLGASLDDQTASPNKGAPRNGCSFEDDLSLGAEANHLLSSANKPESCFGLAADQKRSQFKERGRSMNSTGSGKSSTVSRVSEVWEQTGPQHPEELPLNLRVSELLDLYEEDPEEVLLNLGFGREEPDLSSKVPSRFFNSSSTARGIDIKVYLGAQMQRMELENPNFALTSRFRQIEVLTNVANEFFQLYSQVSGQPVQRINSRDQGGGGEGGGVDGGGGGGGGGGKGPGGAADKLPPPLKRNNSALNVAKLLKKSISKHNLLAAASESPEAQTPSPHARLNGHAPSDHAHTNGHAEREGSESDQQGETTCQKQQEGPPRQSPSRKKDSCPLATVTEETNGDGETDSLTDNSPGQDNTGVNGNHPPESADLQAANQRTEEQPQVVQEENSLTSTPVKAPQALAPPHLAQLRTEHADSFDMEEIGSNDDEVPPTRSSRATDLLRTVSQQSDSSGFAEEPSADSNSFLKVQESSDSCDSETTVTSHPSQDVATPLAQEHPVFELPEPRIEEETAPVEEDPASVSASASAPAADPAPAPGAERTSSKEEDEEEHDGSPEEVPQYTAHYFSRNALTLQEEIREVEEEEEEERRQEEGPAEGVDTDPGTESKVEPELEGEVCSEVSPAEPDQSPPDTAADTVEDLDQEDAVSLDMSEMSIPPPPASPVLNALLRAKHQHLRGTGPAAEPMPSEAPLTPGRGRGVRRFPMQRSASLPTSLLSPSTVVSSVRIRFGRGQASCTRPRYSFKYSQDESGDEDEVDGHTSRLSTLIINPASNPPQPRNPSLAPPKPIPPYLMRSLGSLQCSSPPPDWSPVGHAHPWASQSIPDLTSYRHLPPNPQQNIPANHMQQQGYNPGQAFPYPDFSSQHINPSPSPSPSPGPYPFSMNPRPQNPSHLHPYGSLPNLHHHHHPVNHHSSMTSLHQPTTSPISPYGGLSGWHQPPPPVAPPHYVSMGNLHHPAPMMHHQNPAYAPQPSYHAAPNGSPFSSPHAGFHGFSSNPYMPYPTSTPQYPLLGPEHGLHPGLAPPAPGFPSGLASSFGLHTGPQPQGPGLNQGPSTTEMQLRRVLHDIRGTVQSLGQNRGSTADMFSENTAALPLHQSLAEFQQRRRSLNLFRSQMMDLELSIIRQQALVYKHLSPADRLELEQLQSLRSAVREELQELEQQLEDRLSQHRSPHRDGSMESLSTASALRAMEPMSDLLREQLLLQSELSYDGRTPTPDPSTRSSSPVRGGGGGGGGGREGEQGQGVYRASINITPALPPRPNARLAEEEEAEERDGGGGGGRVEPLVGAAAAGAAAAAGVGGGGGVRVDNLQQLIREIRESVTQEVRQEIYSELLASVSPRRSPLPPYMHHHL